MLLAHSRGNNVDIIISTHSRTWQDTKDDPSSHHDVLCGSFSCAAVLIHRALHATWDLTAEGLVKALITFALVGDGAKQSRLFTLACEASVRLQVYDSVNLKSVLS